MGKGRIPKGISAAGRNALYTMVRWKAAYNVKRATRSGRRGGRVKVGFVVQMPEIWDKEAGVFEAMCADGRFEPWLIVVPAYDFAASRIGEYGDELAYFTRCYGEERILRARQEGDWLDLKGLGLDYVFYQRGWEQYLPRQYRASRVIRYAKTCYIPYCFQCLAEAQEHSDSSFFMNLYLFFCCSRQQLSQQERRTARTDVFVGYPALEKPVSLPDALRVRTVLWTPRWTDDAETGGSTFFRYWERIPEIKENHPELHLILRPHPLTFSNAVRTNRLTQEEVEAYQERIRSLGIVFDEHQMVEDTFPVTDVLISDFSSVLIPYALTGKPIIYCSKTTGVAFTDTMQQVVDCSYLAEDWEEVTACLEDLIRGIDPLREKRERLARQLAEEHQNASERILEVLLRDAKGKPEGREITTAVSLDGQIGPGEITEKI